MKPEVKSILKSFIPGTLLVLVLTAIKYYEESHRISFAAYGLFPRSIADLRGIFTFPLIHKDYEHLFSNAIPLFILMAMLRYFYREMSWKVVLLTWLLGGFWLWLGGRASYHIGASGLVYGLSSFIFFSGIWRRERRMMAVSLIVVFLYGGMIWGIFPWFKETSWEGHLFGGLAGLMLSWVYRKEGPQRVRYQWEDEPEEEAEMPEPEGNLNQTGSGHPDEEKALPPDEKLAQGNLFQLSPPEIRYEYIKPEKEPDRDTDQEQAPKS